MKKFAALSLACLLATAACSGTESQPGGDGAQDRPTVLGPNEKADDFRSESAQEYFVRGEATIELDADMAGVSEEARLQRVRELIPYKQVVIGYFLNAYLIDKSGDGADADYGGFKALTKNGSYEDLGIAKTGELTYSFRFVQEVGGQLDLLAELGRAAGAEPNADGSWSMELAVGDLTNNEMTQLDHGNEWYRRSPWSGFTPDSVDASRYYMQPIELVPQERSDDAWVDYHRLFADGTVDAEIFFGWDYHDAYHQKHAESTYRWLVARGFDSPVDSWADYAANRAPLTKTIVADGEPVEVRVTLWWGEPGTETDPDTDAGGRALEEAMRRSLKNNEITGFSGHSGPWYGFALANWRQTAEGDLDDSEIPALDMPSDKYQIVLAEGCDTYALGEAFWANPNKADRTTLDIITTTSFSNAGTNATVTDLFKGVIGTDSQGNHQATRYSEILADMDSNSYWFKTMYGVHGIDDNPHRHPYADAENVCLSCSTDADCGGEGNVCANLGGDAICTFECTADDGCPTGFRCRETQTGGWISTSVCVPDTYTCDDVPAADAEPQVRVSELLADPAAGLEGDANGDGQRSAYADEFVELVNDGGQPVDLGRWTLSDNVSVRFTFPADVTLAPGERLVVFGGGDPAAFDLDTDALVFVAEGLYLNNGGDALAVGDADGRTVDRVSYGREGGGDLALVRDGDGLRPAELATPGR